MTVPRRYARLVREVMLRSLAESEGKLRARAEEMDVSAARIRRTLTERGDLLEKVRDEAEREVARLLAEMREARAEAEGIAARAASIADPPPGVAGNVSPAAPEKPVYGPADVALTLRSIPGSPGAEGWTLPPEVSDVAGRLELGEAPSVAMVSALQSCQWPSGIPTATAMTVLNVLRGLVK